MTEMKKIYLNIALIDLKSFFDDRFPIIEFNKPSILHKIFLTCFC